MAQPFEMALLVQDLEVVALVVLVPQQFQVPELAEQVVQVLLQAFLVPLITMQVVEAVEIILPAHLLLQVALEA